MKRLVLILVLLPVAGCAEFVAERQPTQEYPTVNVPRDLRQSNWIGNRKQGSCVHATLVSLLRWQGRYSMADWWRRTHGDGEVLYSVLRQLDSAGVRYAATGSGDVRFLEWACETRRGAGISVRKGAHMVALVHLDNEWAAILDNKDVSRYRWIPRDELIAEWHRSQHWAIVPVYSPAAPLPW